MTPYSAPNRCSVQCSTQPYAQTFVQYIVAEMIMVLAKVRQNSSVGI